jgi:hypothetical protein
MRTCERCSHEIIRARGLCNRHYIEARRYGFGPVERSKPVQRSEVEVLAQAGKNRACVECGDEPLFGGMRCLDCFRVRCDERSKYEARVNV